MVVVGWVWLAARAASAHEVGLSRGVYAAQGGEVTATLTFARAELMALAPGLEAGEALTAETEGLQGLVGAVEVTGDGEACRAALVGAGWTEEDGAQVRLRFRCPGRPGRLGLRMPASAGLTAGHRHLAQVEVEGAALGELVLRGGGPAGSVELGAGPMGAMGAEPMGAMGAMGSARAYFVIGVEHILIGADHLVFLLGLVVVGGRLRSLLAVVTAFTVGHSLSLALATLEVWRPETAWVEPAIALSIVYVGIENFFVGDAAGRWRVTLPFGFIHGLGFAGALAEVGVPREAVGAALVLFNLGVEVGQLLVLALALPILAWLARAPGYRRVDGRRWISGAIVVAGMGWFLQRMLA